MSEIRVNIIDENRTISGVMHGSFGDVLVASLTAEPETVDKLEKAVERFVLKESDWSVFRSFRKGKDFEAWDAGLLVIDLAAKVVMADSTYSYYSAEGSVRVRTDDGEDFNLPYKLSGDWKCVGSLPEFYYEREKVRERRLENPAFDVRGILFGKPLFEFIAAEYLANENSADENLCIEIHAKWLMTAREDLRGKTPREILLEKREFISADLHSRFLQWTFTKIEPPALPKNWNAYKFAGFGTHEIVVYYDLFRHLLSECFENDMSNAEGLEKIADGWLNNPQRDFSGRTPAKIIESERRRINLTMSAHECIVDEDCPACEMTALDFIDTPMIWGLDGSNMEYDRFEFSFHKTREDWETEQREHEEFNREFDENHKAKSDEDIFDDDILL